METQAREIGNQAETRARQFLEQHGLCTVAKNFHCRSGEIDLIMTDDTFLVFVEVRYRRSSKYGDGAFSVSSAKQNKIRASALSYLQKYKLFEKCPVRFDVVAMSPNNIDWIQGAF